MSSPGPWGSVEPPAPPPRRAPVRSSFPAGPWLLLIAAICAAVWGLSRLFPGRITGEAWGGVAGGVAVAAYMGASVLSRQQTMRRTTQHLAIWAGVVAVLLLGYSFKNELGDLGARMRSSVVPSYPVDAAGQVVITQDEDGGYYVVASVNGQPVRFLVDTGASDIVLSPADAQRLGVDLSALQFNKAVETANGKGFGAPYTADSLSLGSISLGQTPMSINKAPMSSSLLGMAFFNRLKSFRFEGGRLILQPKS